jgi:hypothetical protein
MLFYIIHLSGDAMYFDKVIFLYALYVAFAYAALALGATYYRQALDDMQAKEFNTGETLFFAVNPNAYIAIAVIFLFFIIFAFFALSLESPAILAYAFPIALAINIVQLLLRTASQKVIIGTHGILLRYIFRAGATGIRYDDLIKAEIQPFAAWYKFSFYTLPYEYSGCCFLNHEQSERLQKLLQAYPLCQVVPYQLKGASGDAEVE